MKGDRDCDAALLERFARDRDEAAFERVVERHGPTVLRVCRSILRREEDVEDAFQATFLVLAKKAGDMRWDSCVGGWLHSAARRLALHLHARTGGRTSREKPLSSVPEGIRHPSADPDREIERRELRGVIDDALRQLPEKYRAPVVLCYLEGKTNQEAARQLGWPAGSMSRRLERARHLLRLRLSSSAVLGTLALAGAALLLSRPRDDRAQLDTRDRVRMAMRTLAGDDRRDCRVILTSLSERHSWERDREQLVEFARKSERVAGTLLGEAPGESFGPWLFQAARMRLAANDLAQAIGRDDPLAALAAARRLDATCIRCHELARP